MTRGLDTVIPRLMAEPRFRWVRHLALQSILLAVSINVFWDAPDELLLTANRFVSFISLYVVFNIMAYVNIFILTPRLFMKNRFFVYMLCVVGLIIFCMAAIGVVDSLFLSVEPEYVEPKQPGLFSLLSSIVSVGFFIMGTSAMVLLKRWISDNMRVGELESETLQSELALLKSQINPHFLFNMLNNSCLLIEKRRPEASDVLLRLRELLRYQMEEGASELVELRRETDFIKDFLELEKVRRDRFGYTVACHGSCDVVVLPPMLFIPFVENAVKHNNDSEKSSHVNISFSVGDGTLVFLCANSKPSVPSAPNDVGGIGLKNIRRRLELLYPERHSLETEDTEDSYSVTLKIGI